MNTQSLPVLMYHYVNRFPGATTVSPEAFEAQCRGMAENGWRGVGLDEAEAFLLHGTPLPRRSLLITFDDGYLDNYVYAWPILRKYGHKGVVFAVTDRLEKASGPRPTLADVRSGSELTLPPVDAPLQATDYGFQERRDLFMSWEAARRLEESGVMAVAAHSARHLAVFAGPEWGPVNRHDRRKAASPFEEAAKRFHVPGTRLNTFNRTDFPVVWGLPRFKERPFLHSRAFIPSPELVRAVRGLVPQDIREARAFFEHPGKVAELEALVASFAQDRLGTPETEEKRRERVRAEIASCAETLRRELGHPVRSLCWPWGSGSDVAVEEARQEGFAVFFTTRMGANPPAAPAAVRRFKVRDAGWTWLRLRLEIYSRPRLAALSAACRL